MDVKKLLVVKAGALCVWIGAFGAFAAPDAETFPECALRMVPQSGAAMVVVKAEPRHISMGVCPMQFCVSA